HRNHHQQFNQCKRAFRNGTLAISHSTLPLCVSGVTGAKGERKKQTPPTSNGGTAIQLQEPEQSP
ncbi:MAG: hypothetical protein WCP07_00510, partial [bacterium]